MKNIKILMIIIGIVIILIVLLLLGIRNPENLNEYDGGEETEAQDTLVEINSNINKETNDYKFFAVDDLINDFMIYINTENQEAVNALIDSSYSQEYNVQNISGMDIYRRKCRGHGRRCSLLMVLLGRVIHDCLKETLYIERECNCIKDVIDRWTRKMDGNDIGILVMGQYIA